MLIKWFSTIFSPFSGLILFFFHSVKHTEREFLLKFSAIEIYNESVRDLLSVDNAPLRLLDDPEVTNHV